MNKTKTILFSMMALLAMTGCTSQTLADSLSKPAVVTDASTESVSDTAEEMIETEETSSQTYEETTETEDTDFRTYEETTEKKETYYQSYPVQTYQKAYAQFLTPLKDRNEAYMIHIDEDSIPELVVIQSLSSAVVYSFDGMEIYEVGVIELGYYTYSFSYRPYLRMTSCESGSVMYGNSHIAVQEFTKEDGYLQIEKKVHITDSKERLMFLLEEAELYGLDDEYLYGFENTILYDIGGNEESWKQPDDYRVTDAQIIYWLTN